MNPNKFSPNTKVRICHTNSPYDGMECKVVGIASEHPTMCMYIILSETPFANGYYAIQLTEHCLEAVDG